MADVESKSDKFKRLATKRVNNALKTIELVGKLSSPAYQYSEEEVEKIFSTLQQTLDKAKASFSPKKTGQNKFQL